MQKGLTFGEELLGTGCRLKMAWCQVDPNITKNPKETIPKNKRHRTCGITLLGVYPYRLLGSQAKRPQFQGYSDSKSPNVSTAIMNLHSVGWKDWPATKRGWDLIINVSTFRPVMRDLRGHLSWKRQHPLPPQSENPMGMEKGCHSEASLFR